MYAWLPVCFLHDAISVFPVILPVPHISDEAALPPRAFQNSKSVPKVPLEVAPVYGAGAVPSKDHEITLNREDIKQRWRADLLLLKY